MSVFVRVMIITALDRIGSPADEHLGSYLESGDLKTRGRVEEALGIAMQKQMAGIAIVGQRPGQPGGSKRHEKRNRIFSSSAVQEAGSISLK